ncbi:MAG: hypothetical protein HKN44_07900 [Ilumatobacter sp.]|nr:hypothetical protein [Ilumatobacter sp.]
MIAVDVTEGEVASQLDLRPLTGADELAVGGQDAAAALALLTRLAPDRTIDSMSVSEIDRGLAQLYIGLYGPRADCRAACAACDDRYDFTLDLAEIVAAQDAEHPGPPDRDGAWTLRDGRRVRAPRPDDLAQGPGGLLARVTVDGDATIDPDAISRFLDVAAPIMTLDFDTRCPHCGADGSVRFDLAVYLMHRLAGEREFLWRETHLIASRYGWSRAEILALPRDDRRSFVRLIDGEDAQRRWSS